jgi:cardiolipin synthase
VLSLGRRRSRPLRSRCMLGGMSAVNNRAERGVHALTRALAVAAVGAGVVYTARILLAVFGPAIPYRLPDAYDGALDSDEFVRFLSVVTNGALRGAYLQRLHNGAEFYPAELAAIRSAEHAVNLEYYEFQRGRVADAVLAALCERARQGVAVRVLVDALGSFSTPSSYFDPLRAAGGQMHWYHPVRWDTWPHINNRTHRKLMVVDGRVGFIGGAGIADHWLYATAKDPVWRDTVFRVEGETVCGLISTFAENWLEASGEVLSGSEQFGFHPVPGGAKSFVVLSTPHSGGTQARVLFQALIRSARTSIRITTPYFLPDPSARRALEHAVRERGVAVEIVTAGPHIDHPIVRTLSERSSRRLLEAGAEIYEYQPAMIHAKLMTVDGQWCVAGSTNFDHRSFGLNDEVNIAVLDPTLARVLEEDFAADRALSQRLTLAELKRRGLFGPGPELLEDAIEWES